MGRHAAPVPDTHPGFGRAIAVLHGVNPDAELDWDDDTYDPDEVATLDDLLYHCADAHEELARHRAESAARRATDTAARRKEVDAASEDRRGVTSLLAMIDDARTVLAAAGLQPCLDEQGWLPALRDLVADRDHHAREHWRALAVLSPIGEKDCG